MGIFNEHSTTSKSGQGGKQIRGPKELVLN